MAQTHSSLSYIYCHLAILHLVWNLKKWPNDNKYNLCLCVFVPNLLIYHKNTMKLNYNT